MPPNVGQISFEDLESTLDLALLQNTKGLFTSDDTTSLYVPLDFSIKKVSGNNDVRTRKNLTPDNEASDKYWAWNDECVVESTEEHQTEINKAEFIKDVLQEEERRQCLVIDATLKENVSKAHGDVVRSDFVDESSNNYWDWEEEKECWEEESGNDCGYWEWASCEVEENVEHSQSMNRKQVLEKIVMEDKIRQSLMADEIVRLLVANCDLNKEGVQVDAVQNDVDDCHSENAESYWHWGCENDVETHLDLTVSCIEKRLRCDSPGQISAEFMGCKAGNDLGDDENGYWSWNEGNGCGVVSSEICHIDVGKEERLRNLLVEEEIRLYLAANNTTKTLMESIRQEGRSCEAAGNGCSSGGYWDW